MATLMDKYFNVRIKLRNDSWTNWEERKDFIPYDGEVIIYDIPTEEEKSKYNLNSLNYQIIKIGDGIKTLKQLPAINELSSALNITTGFKKGTISVGGQDIYVKGLNDNTIMCFELKDNYVTSIKLDKKIYDNISPLRNSLEELEVNFSKLKQDINGITGGNWSKITLLENSLNEEIEARKEADRQNLNIINKLSQDIFNNYITIQELDEKYTTLNNNLIAEQDARVQQDNLINGNINKINKRIDNLSLPDGSAGKVELKETNNGYELLQDSITIGSIIFPEDNFLIRGEAIKDGNASKINLFTKDDNPISIDITNLINTYKAEQLGERIQLNINSNNIISADIINKSLTNLQIADGTINEENLSPELKIKINSSGGEGSNITNEQLNNLKQYIDELVDLETSATFNEAKEYADTIKSDLLNGAGAAYDTLKELGNLIDKNTNALTALNNIAVNKADKEHTHYYASSSTIGGAALSAEKLNTNAGNSEKPVYFSDGIPVPITYTIKSDVPANAKFTDTTYSEATLSNAGLMTPEMLLQLNTLISSAGVTSINGKQGAVTLSYEDVQAAPKEHTHYYASSSSIGGSAISAEKLNKSEGNSYQPVYFLNGVPQSIDYTIQSNVPANAKFTDTTYSEATTSKAGLMTPEMVVKLNSLSSTGGLVSSVNGKIGNVILSYEDVEAAPTEHVHQYAASSSAGGPALSAEKLNKSVGNSKKPVYFLEGVPTPITYTIESNVPADAKFTDTTYSEATSLKAGLMPAAMYSKLNGIAIGAAVTSVNNKQGAVTLSYEDVQAAPAEHTHNYAGSSSPGGAAYFASSLGTSTNSFTATTNNTLTLSAVVNNKRQWAIERQSSTADGILVHYYDTSGKWTAEKRLWQEGDLITGAVYNDYAEYRSQNEFIEPGYVTYCDDDGKLKKTTKKLQKFEGVVSDTFGFVIGETEKNKTPLAVSGRVLVYGNTEEHFHSGDAVCAGPNGMVYRMTRDEIAKFPDRIVGIVSEIPTYENWGTSNIKVNGRIWIKVR